MEAKPAESGVVEEFLDRLTVDYYGHNAVSANKRRRLMLEPSSTNRAKVIVLRRVRV